MLPTWKESNERERQESGTLWRTTIYSSKFHRDWIKGKQEHLFQYGILWTVFPVFCVLGFSTQPSVTRAVRSSIPASTRAVSWWSRRFSGFFQAPQMVSWRGCRPHTSNSWVDLVIAWSDCPQRRSSLSLYKTRRESPCIHPLLRERCESQEVSSCLCLSTHFSFQSIHSLRSQCLKASHIE